MNNQDKTVLEHRKDIIENLKYFSISEKKWLIRRFWKVDLEPTVDDWLDWARKSKKIDPLVITFIEKYPARLRHAGQMEPGKVYPNPASWDRLNTALQYAGMAPSAACGENYNPLFYSMCTGFIGTETTIAFVDFVKNHEFKFSAEDVLNDYEKNKDFFAKEFKSIQYAEITPLQIFAICGDMEMT